MLCQLPACPHPSPFGDTFPKGGRLIRLSTQKSPLAEGFFAMIYFSRARYRKVTMAARVQTAFGLNAVLLVPTVMFRSTAHSTACA